MPPVPPHHLATQRAPANPNEHPLRALGLAPNRRGVRGDSWIDVNVASISSSFTTSTLPVQDPVNRQMAHVPLQWPR